MPIHPFSLFISALFLCSCASQNRPVSSPENDDRTDHQAESPPHTKTVCEAAYDSLIATGRVVLGMEGLLWGDRERLEFIPLPDTRSGSRLQQINRFHGAESYQDAQDHFECEDGRVEIPRFDTDIGQFWEQFEPTMAWSRLPLTPGQSWTWSGVTLNKCEDPDACTHEEPRPATARYEVRPGETLHTAIGDLNAIPVHMNWTWEHQDHPGLIQTTWFLESAPMVMIRRERRTETAPGSFIEGTLTLISLENPP